MQKALFPGYSVGPDAYEDIVNICSAYGKKAAIIGGRKALAAAEPQIRKAVEDSGIEIIGTFWYGGEASRENMEMLRPQVADADMIFAVGGGKAIDTCKVLAHETNRPFFTFPTIASTCASCTSLGIVYHPDGSLREYSFSKIPPDHIFIDTEIIAKAPYQYLWAGIGDTYAKYYEATISSRDERLEHFTSLGVALSKMCRDPLLEYGPKAFADHKQKLCTYDVEQVILAIVVTTGIASIFLTKDFTPDYNSGLAHAIFYALTSYPVIEERHLHGEVVGFGVLLALLVDGQEEEFEKVYELNRSINLPVSLEQIEIPEEQWKESMTRIPEMSDVKHYPYRVTPEMLDAAMTKLKERVKKDE